MFDPIRELISQNQLREAFQACDELTLSASNRSQLIALRRRWDMISTDLIGNTREERLIRIDENQLVQDLLAWLDFMDSDVQHDQPVDRETSTSGQEKKKSSPWGIGLILLLILGVSVGGVYTIRQLNKGDITEQKEPTRPTGSNNGDRDLPAELDQPQRDPRAASTTGALMTSGAKEKLTVAVYLGRQASTKYMDQLSQQVARYLSSYQSFAIPTNVLTDAFHNSEEREAINLKGRIQNPPALNPNRASYLLLIDFRNINREGNGRLTLCLYDVARKGGFEINKEFALSGDDATIAKQLAKASQEYLQDRKGRGLYK